MLPVCLEATIRLLFEILRFGFEHLLFVIILGLLLMFKRTGLFVIGALGILIEISMLFISIPFFGKIILFLGGATAILRLAWIFAMMVIVSEANTLLKFVSIIPVALLGASIEAIFNLIGMPLPLVTLFLIFILRSKNLSNIFLSVISVLSVFVIITTNETICNWLNNILITLKNIRQEGLLQLTGINKFL
jgi:hypothetical protein